MVSYKGETLVSETTENKEQLEEVTEPTVEEVTNTQSEEQVAEMVELTVEEQLNAKIAELEAKLQEEENR